ncbi:MAG TPA: methyltransferase domain-containing protein [Solirubrobacteraceae bacterium]|nr:methyltransferase domain-containing protein [Solirubrobacteraceae bacterium]
MDRARLAAERDRLAREHGGWTENVAIADGLFTLGAVATESERRTAAVLQTVGDALGGTLRGARVLDLGAGEGRTAVELARHGARVLAVEGREGNAAKLRFLKGAHGLDALEVVRADARAVSRATHGSFDVVLCLRLLYHLDAGAAAALLRTVAELAPRVVLVETLVARAPRTEVTVDGRRYAGRRVREFDPGASAEEQERLGRSSLGNPESFWFTRPSLLNLIADAGFTSVHEVHVPRYGKSANHVMLAAFRGTPLPVLTGPRHPEPARWPERERPPVHPADSWRGDLKLRLAPYAPAALKRWRRRRRAPRSSGAR